VPRHLDDNANRRIKVSYIDYTDYELNPQAAAIQAILDIADFLDGIKPGNFDKVYQDLVGYPGQEPLPRRVIIMALDFIGIKGFPAAVFANEILLIRGEFSPESV
jgi:hypothetical protein